MNKTLNINGQEIKFEILKKTNEIIRFEYNEQVYSFEIHHQTDTELILKDENCKLFRFHISTETGDLLYRQQSYSKEEPGFTPKSTSQGDDSSLITPLPGKVISVIKKNGDTVIEGDLIAVIEAMKMEHRFYAPKSGTIMNINLAVGDTVPEGHLIGEINDSN